MSGIIFGLLEGFSSLSANASLGIFIAINCLLFFRRKDHAFIEDMPLSKFRYYAVDHALVSFPFLLLLLAFAKFQTLLFCVIALFGLVLLFSFLPSSAQNTQRFQWRNLNWGFIPPKYFEWRFLLKRYALFLVLLYILAIVFVKYQAVLPVVALLMIILMLSCFEHFEPKELIFTKTDPARFLFKVLLKNTWPVQLGLVPLYILYAYTHPSLYLVLILVIVAVQSGICFGVFYKYSMYDPFRKKLYGGALSNLFVFFLIVPGLVLICVGLSVWTYFKARRNLSLYW